MTACNRVRTGQANSTLPTGCARATAGALAHAAARQRRLPRRRRIVLAQSGFRRVTAQLVKRRRSAGDWTEISPYVWLTDTQANTSGLTVPRVVNPDRCQPARRRPAGTASTAGTDRIGGPAPAAHRAARHRAATVTVPHVAARKRVARPPAIAAHRPEGVHRRPDRPDSQLANNCASLTYSNRISATRVACLGASTGSTSTEGQARRTAEAFVKLQWDL